LADKRKRARGRGKLRDALIPVAGFILVVFLILGTYSAATSAGWQMPNIGLPPWIQGLTGQGQGGTIQTVTSTYWNGNAWVTSTSTIANNGGVTLIPSGVIATKMSLVATYTDNTNETIFENSTLPGFAWISTVHGKQIRQMTALAVVAVLNPQNLPAGSVADFKLNFTAFVTQLNRARWNFVERLVPFMNNGTLAVAVPPPFSVLPAEVFPDNPTGTGSRQVVWNLHAEVTISGPGVTSFTLVPVNDLSSASFDFNGQLSGGCTDCSGTGGGISGANLGPNQAGMGSVTDLCQEDPSNAKCNRSPPTTEPKTVSKTETQTQSKTYVQATTIRTTETFQTAINTYTACPPAQACYTVTQSATATRTTQTATTAPYFTDVTHVTVTNTGGTATSSTPGTYSTLDCSGTVCKVDTHTPGGTTRSTYTSTEVKNIGTHTYADVQIDTSGGLAGTGIHTIAGQKILLDLLPYSPWRMQLGRTVWLVNPAAIWITFIAALGFAGILSVYVVLKRKER
jgi:hypothetical protein